jgi:hypothetical protein
MTPIAQLASKLITAIGRGLAASPPFYGVPFVFVLRPRRPPPRPLPGRAMPRSEGDR